MTVAADLIIVTEAAANKFTQLLDEEQKTDAGLRVFVQGGGCSGFQYGLMIEDGAGDAEVDKIFRSNGVTIFVDPISIRHPGQLSCLISSRNLSGDTGVMIIEADWQDGTLRWWRVIRRLERGSESSSTRPGGSWNSGVQRACRRINARLFDAIFAEACIQRLATRACRRPRSRAKPRVSASWVRRLKQRRRDSRRSSARRHAALRPASGARDDLAATALAGLALRATDDRTLLASFAGRLPRGIRAGARVATIWRGTKPTRLYRKKKTILASRTRSPRRRGPPVAK